LAGKGYDAEKLSRSLNSINIKTTFEPLEPIAETDIESYLRHEHDMIILTAIEEAKKKVGYPNWMTIMNARSLFTV
jgi:nuclear pore complex protein Nup93